MDTFNSGAFYSGLFGRSLTSVKTKHYYSKHCNFCASDYLFKDNFYGSVCVSVVFYDDYFHYAFYNDNILFLNQKLSYNDFFSFNSILSKILMEVENG